MLLRRHHHDCHWIIFGILSLDTRKATFLTSEKHTPKRYTFIKSGHWALYKWGGVGRCNCLPRLLGTLFSCSNGHLLRLVGSQLLLGGLGHILNDEQPSSRENSSAGLTEREGEVLEQCLNIRGTFCFLQRCTLNS